MVIQQLVPTRDQLDLEELARVNHDLHAVKVFDPIVVDFANDLSKLILKDRSINRIPAYVSLAYWLRRSNVQRIIKENVKRNTIPNVILSPLGTVFHVCPSNVDTMFIYSLFVSLLAGNKNLLRISTRTQDGGMDQLFLHFSELLTSNKFEKLKNYVRVLSYPRNKEINKRISKISDARVIWGGDETVSSFKAITDNPRSKDLVFADRQSHAIFKTSEFISVEEKVQKEIVRNFFNDSYSFDQKGCSSPQLILTYGSEIDQLKFREVFYPILEEIVTKQYDYDPASLASLKMNQLATDAVDSVISSYYGPNKNLVIADLVEESTNHVCGGGYFYLKNIEDLSQLGAHVHSKVQTLTYHGLSQEDKEEIIQISHGKGVERLVPIGKGLSFDYIWDGYNLIDELVSKKYID